MDLTLLGFIDQAMQYPVLWLILVLVLFVTIVSGATDAPNAISTAVASRCLKPNTAIALAAVFNMVGLIGMTYISTSVAYTMFNMVDFSGNTENALMAVLAAMVAAIIWGCVCWLFGIPCSKSHSLIAGVTGGAIAMNGWGGVVPDQWAKVLIGMAFSLIAGFLLGWIFNKIVEFICKGMDRRSANTFFRGCQDVCACALSFLHGGQDGQKFMAIGILGISLSFGQSVPDANGFPLWLMVISSLAISLGTAVGGKRIIKTVANMTKLEIHQGSAANFSTVTTLITASLTGMPVSTSHCNSSAIMGVGASRGLKKVDWGIAKNMLLAWVITFPCCGLIGYVLAQLFMMIL